MNQDEIYKKIIDNLVGPDLVIQSAKQYLSVYKRVMKEVFNDEGASDKLGSIEYVDKIIEYVKKDNIPLNSKDNILKGYFKCVKALGYDTQHIDKKFTPLRQQYKRDKEYQPPSQKEIENMIPFDEVVAKRDVWKSKLTDKLTKYDLYYVALSLFTYIPSLRSEDFVHSLLIEDSSKHDIDELNSNNYLCLTNKKLLVKKYKTYKANGDRNIDIPDTLIEILKDFKNKSNSKWVICSTTLNKLESNSFCRLMNEATEKKISSSMMRKIFASEKIIDGNMPIEKRKDVAHIMGHSVKVQQVHYSKFNNLLPSDNDTVDDLLKQLETVNRIKDEINKKLFEKWKIE